jgi:tRNA G18 (ribose-2'-O)-methylase SpoU
MSLKLFIQTITSLDMPELAPYRTLRRPLEHQKQGIFVAEGEKVVRRLLESPLVIDSVLVTPRWLPLLEAELPDRSANTSPKVYVGDQSLIESIVGYTLHQGIMAVARIPQPRLLPELIEAVRSPHLLLALDGLVNAENVGLIVRNAAAFGVDAIVVGETSSSPYLRRAVRNSMGAVFRIPVVHVENLVSSLQLLLERYGTHVIAATPKGAQTILETDFRGNVCIVLGNEGSGISPEVLTLCRQHVSIPMVNQTDSLNVATASAVFLYEAKRQRTSS